MDFGQKLLQILTDQGELTVEAAEEIKLAAINSDTPVVDILLKRHVVDEEKLLKIFSLCCLNRSPAAINLFLWKSIKTAASCL